MSDAYAQGIHHALTALAWAAGVLTALAWVACGLFMLWRFGDNLAWIVRRARRWSISHRLKREHARSGRA